MGGILGRQRIGKAQYKRRRDGTANPKAEQNYEQERDNAWPVTV